METPLKPLNDQVSVSGQLLPADMASLAEAGFQTVINNRPDAEELGQARSSDIEAAARAAGLEYLHAPVQGLPDRKVIDVVATRLHADIAEGRRTAMFCRSGMRSAATWAMAQRLDGADPDDLRAAAAVAGYDLSRLPL